MARIKPKRASTQAFSCKFGGIGNRDAHSGMGVEDLCNFCISQDGSIHTRSGFRLHASFAEGAVVRGVWEGTLDGTPYRFAAVGTIVYRWDEATNAQQEVGTIADGDGLVEFCCYRGQLYLLDGNTILVYRPSYNQFMPLEAYAPLYGMNWHPTAYGDVYEEINLLSPRLRVHYHNATSSKAFVLPFYAEKIDQLRADGRVSTAFTFTMGDNTVYLTSSTAPSTVEIAFTVSLNEETRAQMLSAQRAYVHRDEGKERMFLFGNDSRLYYSQHVDEISRLAAKVFYPNSEPLYFRSDDVLFLGDASSPVTSLCPMYHALWAFTAERVYCITFSDGVPDVTPALEGFGSRSFFGTVARNHEVLALCNGGLYALSASSTHPEQISLKCLSDAIDGRIPVAAFARMHLLRYTERDEIWLRDPENTSGEVWVWNCALETWYRFSHIKASFFFQSEEQVGFACGNTLYVFDHTVHTDDGAEIISIYKTGYLDFDAPEQIRRSMRAILCADINGGGGYFSLENERGNRIYSLKAQAQGDLPDYYDFRALGGRFRFVRVTVSLTTTALSHVYRCDLYTKP